MTHEFEVREEVALAATPEQVWEAITTGPGVDSWFMGRNEIEPGEGGRTRMTLPGMSGEGTVTAWEPGKRFAYRSDEAPDGQFMAFEYLIEGRAGGGTVLRMVHNGMLGDDWEAEYDALSFGDRMYLENLAAYLKHFPDRTATFNMFLPGPQVPGADRRWSAFRAALGLAGSGPIPAGQKVRMSVDGVPPAEGIVEYAHPRGFTGVLAGDALYMFVHGYQDSVVVILHSFAADPDPAAIEGAWGAWLERAFG